MTGKRITLLFMVLLGLLPFIPVEAQDQKTGLIQNDAAAFNGYTLLAPEGSTHTHLIDNEGRVVNSWKSDYPPGQSAYLLENGHLLRTASLGPVGNSTFHGGGAGGRVEEFDWDGNLVWGFEYSSAQHLLHHDIERLPNGNVLMIAWERKTAGEAVAAGRNPEPLRSGELWPDHTIEVQPTGPTSGRVVWEWHVWDHLIQDFDPSKANYGVVADHPELVDINFNESGEQLSPEEREQLEALGYLAALPRPVAPNRNPRPGDSDWNHTNSIAYNAELDQIALSVLGFSEIWVIDHSTTTEEAAGHTGGKSGKGGDILYRWGNPQAYRAGTAADQQLFAQHDAHWIAPGLKGAGNLLVFNNGRRRPDGDYSSVDEIVPPVDKEGRYTHEPGTAFGPGEPVWSYTAPDKISFYSGHLSGASRLPNGNTLICSGENGTIFEVTQGKEVVWKYINPVRGEGPRGRPPMPPRFDKDGDGLVTFEEASVWPFMDEGRFKRLDVNGDGVLGQDELPKGPPHPPGFGPGIGGPEGPRGGPPVPSRFDEDRDGLVTFEEASAWPFMDEGRFKRLDVNGDGVLGQDELPKGPPPGLRGPGRGPLGGGGPPNGLFKVNRYAPDFPGLAGKDLTPGKPLEADRKAPEQLAHEQQEASQR